MFLLLEVHQLCQFADSLHLEVHCVGLLGLVKDLPGSVEILLLYHQEGVIYVAVAVSQLVQGLFVGLLRIVEVVELRQADTELHEEGGLSGGE